MDVEKHTIAVEAIDRDEFDGFETLNFSHPDCGGKVLNMDGQLECQRCGLKTAKIPLDFFRKTKIVSIAASGGTLIVRLEIDYRIQFIQA